MSVIVGDCRDVLTGFPDACVQTVVTSPPYFGLRDYGTAEWEGGEPGCDHRPPSLHPDRNEDRQKFGDSWATHGSQLAAHAKRTECAKCGAAKTDRQIGLEPSPEEFVAVLVGVFREVRRVLRDDGTVWLNLGDSYAQYDGQGNLDEPREPGQNGAFRVSPNLSEVAKHRGPGRHSLPPGLKRKDLIGIPWMVAFALRADGWYLRSDIIWSKPNPMPESVTDRPTKAHEYVFLLSKSARYFYDAGAIREGQDEPTRRAATFRNGGVYTGGRSFNNAAEDTSKDSHGDGESALGRNKRSVWTVATQPFPGAHFATFPPKFIEPCILAGSPPKCCGVCGAPWRRVVERKFYGNLRTEDNKDGAHDLERGITRNEFGGQAKYAEYEPPRTVGWAPTCGHDAPTRPAIVLDPFAGAGTTGVVCGWHGREFIGIELSPEYARMARDRIALEGRPGGRREHDPPRVADGQLRLV